MHLWLHQFEKRDPAFVCSTVVVAFEPSQHQPALAATGDVKPHDSMAKSGSLALPGRPRYAKMGIVGLLKPFE